MRIIHLLSQSFPIIIFIAFSLTLAQKILIQNLYSHESIDSGIMQDIPIPDFEYLQGISVFGWIRVVPSALFGRIFYMQTSSLQDKTDDQPITKDTIFSLSYSQWVMPKLLFTCQIKDKEEYSFIHLLPEELNSWIFVYLGHVFLLTRQTYFKYSSFNQQTITKNVKEIEIFNNCQIFAGRGEFKDMKFFKGDIERLSIHTGVGAYKESSFYSLFVFHPESDDTCAVGFTECACFTECAYTGEKIDLCRSALQTQVKSIHLKSSLTVDLCIGNALIRAERNIECIEEFNLKGLGQLKHVEIVSLDWKECTCK